MKTSFVCLVLAVGISVRSLTAQVPASPTTPPPVPQKGPGTAQKELQALITKIQAKLGQGLRAETDYVEELKEFDTLLTRHKGEKTDDVAQILFMKAMLYVQVFDSAAKGIPILKQVKSDFPGTRFAENVDAIIANAEQAETFRKIQESLAIGTKFPDFSEKDVAGKSMSVANHKGKVVLVDFWATWCGPCVRELPYVLTTYQKYHPKGFEILGISFDQELQKLTDFTKAQSMPWQQFFDHGASNKLAMKYGVASIPTTYLLDGEGKIIGKSLRGEQLEEAVAAALTKK